MDRRASRLFVLVALAGALASPSSSFGGSPPAGVIMNLNALRSPSIYQDAAGDWWFDQMVENRSGVPLQSCAAQLEFYDDTLQSAGIRTYPVSAFTLNDASSPSGGYFSYVHAKLPSPMPSGPGGVANRARTRIVNATGISAPGAYALRLPWVSINWGPMAIGPDFRSTYSVQVTNNATFTVGPVMLVSSEDKQQTAPPNYSYFIDALYAAGPSRLMPGQTSDPITVVGGCAMSEPLHVRTRGLAWAEALPYPDAHVWRFYSPRTGTHFYTADTAERDAVIANLGSLYAFEGEAYAVVGRIPANDTILWRFFNKRTGTHFYTADAGEKDSIIANLGWLYSLDGPAYYVSDTPEGGATAIWRFYNKRTGTHFYTADPNERDSIIANLGWLYSLDGPAFYLAP